MNNDKIINGILQNDKKTIQWIYLTLYPKIERLIINNHGVRQDAADVFQDSLLIILIKIKNGNFHIRVPFHVFFYSICKKIWLHNLRTRKYTLSIENVSDNTEEFLPFDKDIEKKKVTLYCNFFDKLYTAERQILYLHFIGFTAKDIMEQLKLRSRKQVYDKIYRCKKKLIESIINSYEFKAIEEL